MVKLETTESKWEVELDVSKFKPEDLKVLRVVISKDIQGVVGGVMGCDGGWCGMFIGTW